MNYKYLLISLFIISLIYSANPYFNLEDFQKYILPATILLVCAIFAISWALSDFFSSSELKAWVKIELRSFISGIVLMLLVITIFVGTNSAVQIFTGNSDSSLITMSISKLNGYNDILQNAYYDLIKASHYLGMISGFGYTAPTNMYFFSLSFMNSPHSGVSSLNSMIMQGATSISQAIFIYSTIIVILDYFLKIIPLVILPIALSLRLFPFTKKIGNTLIALSIGAAIIFPISVLIVSIFHDIAMEGVSNPVMDFSAFHSFSYPAIGWFCGDSNAIAEVAKTFAEINELGWGLIAGLICSAVPPGFFAYFIPCFTFTSEVVYPTALGVYQAAFWGIALADYASFFGEVDVAGIYNSLAVFLENVIWHVLMCVIDSLLIIIITVVGTKSVSMAIGGEGYFYGIQRLLG